MHDRFGVAGFLAAYNAGPGRYMEYVAPAARCLRKRSPMSQRLRH